MKNLRKSVRTIFEDPYFLSINKPPGLLTIQDRFDHSKDNLYGYLKRQYADLKILHRLDRDTSGLILFAKGTESQQAFSDLIQGRQIQKKYHVLVSTVNGPESGSIDVPIERIHGINKMRVAKNGKDSLTHFRLLQTFDNSYSLYEARLETGRTHQIRVHFHHAGLPLAFDPVYGSKDPVLLSDFKRKYKHKKWQEEKPILARLSLHSFSVDFTHPFDDQNLHLVAEYPADFKNCLRLFRKYLKD